MRDNGRLMMALLALMMLAAGVLAGMSQTGIQEACQIQQTMRYAECLLEATR